MFSIIIINIEIILLIHQISYQNIIVKAIILNYFQLVMAFGGHDTRIFVYILQNCFRVFFLYFLHIHKIINTLNHMVYISEYQPTSPWSKQSFNTIFSLFGLPEAEIQELK